MWPRVGFRRRRRCGARAGALASEDQTTALLLATLALQEEPYSEPAHCLAIAAHLANDDRAAARRALDTCWERLAELGLTPTPQVAHLERAYLGDVGQ